MRVFRLGCRSGAFLLACSMSIAAVVLGLLSSTARAAQVVVLKPSAKDANVTDVYVRDCKTGKTTKFVTLNDVDRQHYHPAEYRDGDLYIIIRRGDQSPREADSNWTDELWRYSRDGDGVKLWSVRGMDFRVRNDAGMIAILAPEQDDFKRILYLLGKDGELTKRFTAADLGIESLCFGGWVGTSLWIRDQQAVELDGLVRLDTTTMISDRFDLRHLELWNRDFRLHAKSLRIAFSDYPPMFDVEGEREFRKNKTPVTLYVYDLRTKKRRTIEKSTAEAFEPKWIDEHTLEYNNPRGKGRVRKTVP